MNDPTKNQKPSKRAIASVCIIDDDPITVFCLKKLLGIVLASKEIRTHNNGKVALQYLKKALDTQKPMPEIIFLDINMPVMDGWQFLEEFIALPVNEVVKIVIATSSIDPVDKEKWEHFMARTKHSITYQNKPIERNRIQEILDKA